MESNFSQATSCTQAADDEETTVIDFDSIDNTASENNKMSMFNPHATSCQQSMFMSKTTRKMLSKLTQFHQ